jgi:hypothetical protein
MRPFAEERAHKHSIEKEILAIVEANVPTQKELRARQQFFKKVCEMQSRKRKSRKITASTRSDAPRGPRALKGLPAPRRKGI